MKCLEILCYIQELYSQVLDVSMYMHVHTCTWLSSKKHTNAHTWIQSHCKPIWYAERKFVTNFDRTEIKRMTAWINTKLKECRDSDTKNGEFIVSANAPEPLNSLFLAYLFLVFNYSLQYYFCIDFRCTAYWLDDHILYKVFPMTFPVPTWLHT